MGLLTEQAILDQLKKAQGETNDRLAALLLAQQETNQLLRWLGQLLTPTAEDSALRR